MSVSNWSSSVGSLTPARMKSVVFPGPGADSYGMFGLQGALQAIGKRGVDIVLSAAALIALSPLLVAVALVIKLDSKGPVFFSQQRWGVHCRKIRVFKFRSMRTDLEDRSGVAQTKVNDVRVTRVGAFLRRTSIDELPQLWNVLRGDMSLVGPRCHPIGMKAGGMLYEELVGHYHARHVIRPGLTGLAQVRGHRGPTTSVSKARMRVASDLHYIKNYSLLMDAKIIYQTLAVELRGGSGF